MTPKNEKGAIVLPLMVTYNDLLAIEHFVGKASNPEFGSLLTKVRIAFKDFKSLERIERNAPPPGEE